MSNFVFRHLSKGIWDIISVFIIYSFDSWPWPLMYSPLIYVFFQKHLYAWHFNICACCYDNSSKTYFTCKEKKKLSIKPLNLSTTKCVIALRKIHIFFSGQHPLKTLGLLYWIRFSPKFLFIKITTQMGKESSFSGSWNSNCRASSEMFYFYSVFKFSFSHLKDFNGLWWEIIHVNDIMKFVVYYKFTISIRTVMMQIKTMTTESQWWWLWL